MLGRIQPIGEELDDAVAAEVARRQADVVDDQKLRRDTGRSRVAIRRCDLSRIGEQSADTQLRYGVGGDGAR